MLVTDKKYAAADLASNIAPFLDAPDHVALRQALTAAFHATLADAQAWIPKVAKDHVAQNTGRRVDLVSDIARPFAYSVMAQFIGLPSDLKQLKSATQSFFHLFAPITDTATFAQTDQGIADARQFVASHITKSPKNSFIGALRDTGLSDATVVDNANLFLADGIENIEAAIVMAFRTLSKQAAVMKDGTTLDAAILECLRLSSPAQIIARVLREDTQLLGKMQPAGVQIFLALGSANLDPAAYANPLDFRLDRGVSPMLAFGQGRHSCIGRQLALLQIKAMLNALIAGSVTIDDIEE